MTKPKTDRFEKKVTGAKNLNFYQGENKSWDRNKLNGWNHLSRKRVSGWDFVMKELNGRISDRWRTCSDNVFFCEKQGNKRKGVGFYRWSARKKKRRFDPRYKPINEWHVSYAINASGQLVRTLYPWRPHTPRTVIQGSSSPFARDFRPSPC